MVDEVPYHKFFCVNEFVVIDLHSVGCCTGIGFDDLKLDWKDNPAFFDVFLCKEGFPLPFQEDNFQVVWDVHDIKIWMDENKKSDRGETFKYLIVLKRSETSLDSYE